MNLKLSIAAAIAAVTLFMTAGSALAVTGVATGDVNIREDAGTEFDVIDTLEAGDEVEIVGVEGGWYEIVTDDGDEGYVSGKYLAVVDYDDDDDYGHHDHHDYYDDVDVEFEYDYGGLEVEFEF